MSALLYRIVATKAFIWAACIGFAWLLIALDVMLLVLWPWPSLLATVFLAGVVVGGLLVAWHRDRGVEFVQERKDVAVDTAMGLAFEAQELEQRISGEHPQVEVWDQDGKAPECCHMCPNPPVGWVRRDGIDERIPLCADCWGPFTEAMASPTLDYSGWSGGLDAAVAYQRYGIQAEDDDHTTAPRSVPGPWAPAAKGEWR